MRGRSETQMQKSKKVPSVGGNVRAYPRVPPGTKFDQDKLRFDLIDDLAEEEMVAVLTFGARKYDSWNWLPLDPNRVVAALRRHLSAVRKGETHDPETGRLHSGHIMCCAMFLCGIEKRILLTRERKGLDINHVDFKIPGPNHGGPRKSKNRVRQNVSKGKRPSKAVARGTRR